MATTITSLIDRIRSEVGDYGDAVTALDGAVSSTSVTTVTVAESKNIASGSFIQIEDESMMVISVNQTTKALTVVRAAKGTTAATTHADATAVYVNLDFSNLQVLNAINSALSSAYPKLYVPVSDETLAVVSGQYEYDYPTGTTMDHLARVEIEDTNADSEFVPIRTWDKIDADSIRLWGTYATGKNIRLVGRKKFTAAALGENLDSNYPADDANTLDYLVTKAVANLLRSIQSRVAQLDSFQGVTDRFTAGQPYVPASTAKHYDDTAAALLKECAMEPQVEYLPHPMRRYLRGV